MTKKPTIDFKDYMPGYPPEDYRGSQAGWMVELQARGLWNGEGWHGDAIIPKDVYWEMLEKLEE